MKNFIFMLLLLFTVAAVASEKGCYRPPGDNTDLVVQEEVQIPCIVVSFTVMNYEAPAPLLIQTAEKVGFIPQTDKTVLKPQEVGYPLKTYGLNQSDDDQTLAQAVNLQPTEPVINRNPEMIFTRYHNYMF